MAFHSEQDGGVLVLTLDRPEARNALSPEILGGIGAGMGLADKDPSIRAVILTAVGDKAFCAGMDLAAFAKGDGGRAEHMEEFIDWQRHGISKPVIAAVNGPAVAGGFELVLACDLVVAADHAFFGLPEIKRALIPGGGGAFIGRRLPPAIAAELCLLGESFSAQRAYELGLVNRVVPLDQVMVTARELADGIAAKGPLAVAALQKVLRTLGDLPLDEAWARFEPIRVPVFASEDAKEGATAFIEKRPPRFQGR